MSARTKHRVLCVILFLGTAVLLALPLLFLGGCAVRAERRTSKPQLRTANEAGQAGIDRALRGMRFDEHGFWFPSVLMAPLLGPVPATPLTAPPAPVLRFYVVPREWAEPETEDEGDGPLIYTL